MNKKTPEDKKQRQRIYRNIEIGVHILTWLYIFISPFLFKWSGESVELARYIKGVIFPLCTCLMFYLNYLWLFPKYFLKKRYKQFILFNVCIIILITIGREILMTAITFNHPVHHGIRQLPHKDKYGFIPPPIFFTIRNLLSYIFVAGLAVFIGLSKRWKIAETARKEAEWQKTEAELKNLKNQINPHFLLNTLNNIYALTSFDKDKAQAAIQELSKMLRYMLYENHSEFVSLEKEADFIRNYISLMKLRQPKNVELVVDIDIKGHEERQVAPLIFISLIENAFKHGVSPTLPSFIKISLKVEDNTIIFNESNTNFPKSSEDKAPGGIGLQQVHSRLNFSYPNSHSWVYGSSENGKEYHSSIKIFNNKKDSTTHNLIAL